MDFVLIFIFSFGFSAAGAVEERVLHHNGRKPKLEEAYYIDRIIWQLNNIRLKLLPAGNIDDVVSALHSYQAYIGTPQLHTGTAQLLHMGDFPGSNYFFGSPGKQQGINHRKKQTPVDFLKQIADALDGLDQLLNSLEFQGFLSWLVQYRNYEQGLLYAYNAGYNDGS